MASVNDLRRITTQERLRSDHIAMMEMLQTTTTENDALKAEITKLKSALHNVSKTSNIDPSTEGEGSLIQTVAPDSTASMVQRILTQENTIKELNAEIKLLRSKATSTDLEIRNLKKSSTANESLRRDLDAMLAAQKAREAEDSGAAASLNELRLQAAQAQNLSQLLEQNIRDHEKCQSDAQIIELALREQLLSLQQRSVDGASASTALQDENASLAARVTVLESTLREMTRVKDDMEQHWRDEYHAETLVNEQSRVQLAAMGERITVLEAIRRELENSLNLERANTARMVKNTPKTEEYPQTAASSGSHLALFMTADPATSTPISSEHCPQPLPAPQQGDQGNSTSDSINDDPTMSLAAGPAGGLFEEFVRLKRENRQLRMQLAQGSSGKSSVGNKRG